jgi:heme exporter protein C
MSIIEDPRLQRSLGILSLALGLPALYLALLSSPAERMLGDLVRIVYVHAPAAWTAYLAYALTALSALMFLARRERAWDRLALASAELGLVLTTVTLLTGMIFGRGGQGWWWRWEDPRLVLTLFLWFIYLAYLILRQFTEGERRAALSAVLAILGLPTMVLNHFAVTLWQRAHPQSMVLRSGGPAVDSPILSTLGLSFAAFTALFFWLLLTRLRLERERDEMLTLLENG